MAEQRAGQAAALEYKGHPLMRKENVIYYGSMSDKYIIVGSNGRCEHLAGTSLEWEIITYFLH